MAKTVFELYVEELEYVQFVFLELGRFPSIQEDKQKHTAHDAVCEEVRKNFQALGYTESLEDRQAMAKFACLHEGRKDLVQWVN